MGELLHQVMSGWKEINSDGKFMVLLLGGILYLWYGRAFVGQKSIFRAHNVDRDFSDSDPAGTLLGYTTILLIWITIPFFSVLLRVYQTRFYDFVWVIAYVPMTLMLSYCMVQCFTDCHEKLWKKNRWKAVGLCALLIAVFLLCGNLKAENAVEAKQEKRQETAQLLDHLRECENAGTICLWAPFDLLEAVRALDGRITLLYGRNMWEEALNAYSYDTYSPEMVLAYQWMEESASWLRILNPPEMERAAQKDCIETALFWGANCIVLPDGQDEEIVTSISDLLIETIEEAQHTVSWEKVNGYYIFWVG